MLPSTPYLDTNVTSGQASFWALSLNKSWLCYSTTSHSSYTSINLTAIHIYVVPVTLFQPKQYFADVSCKTSWLNYSLPIVGFLIHCASQLRLLCNQHTTLLECVIPFLHCSSGVPVQLFFFLTCPFITHLWPWCAPVHSSHPKRTLFWHRVVWWTSYMTNPLQPSPRKFSNTQVISNSCGSWPKW